MFFAGNVKWPLKNRSDTPMKLVNANDWKAVHFQNRTILRSDRNLYPEPDWWALVSTVEVEPMAEPGHYKAI